MPACAPALAALAAVEMGGLEADGASEPRAAAASDATRQSSQAAAIRPGRLARLVGDCILALRPSLPGGASHGIECRRVLHGWAAEPGQARKLWALVALLGGHARLAAAAAGSEEATQGEGDVRPSGLLVRAVCMAAGRVMAEVMQT